MKLSTFAFLTTFSSNLSLLALSSNIINDHRSDSPLQRYFARSEIESRDVDDGDGWVDLTVGILMKRDGDDDGSTRSRNSSALSKRSLFERPSQSTHVLVPRNEIGHWKLPSTWAEAANLVKRAPKHAKRGVERLLNDLSVKITWYDGHDLLNPSCVQHSSWAPTDDSMAAAVTIEWSGKPACGKFVKIAHKSNPSTHVVVRIVDSCGGCPSGTAHIDLTKGAFEKLYPLDVGMVSGLKAKIVKAPVSHKWTKQDVARYGPKKL